MFTPCFFIKKNYKHYAIGGNADMKTENIKTKILSIKVVNEKIRNAGFKHARIKYQKEVTDDEREKSSLVAVLENHMRSSKGKSYSFSDDVLSPTLGVTVKSVVWHKDDCVKIDYVDDGRPDNDDDV